MTSFSEHFMTLCTNSVEFKSKSLMQVLIPELKDYEIANMSYL